MTATPRAKYLTEMADLTARFEELAEALKPVRGEIDTMIVPVSVMRRLMQFSESSLSRLQKLAEFLPDEDLAEILAADERRCDESSNHVTRPAATTVSAEPPEETFWVLDDAALESRCEAFDGGARR
jgi:hypothetical protein